MRILIASDLHTEFHKDSGKTVFQELAKNEGVDVLVLAGDTGLIRDHSFQQVIQYQACRLFSHVVAVLGNHEFYGSDREKVMREVSELKQKCPNFHPLENDTVTINGQRFVGCTLWFPDRPRSVMHRHGLSDFHYIKNFVGWVFTANTESQSFLRRTLTQDDIVVTHHIPSWQGTLPYWWSQPMSDFFVCELDTLIEEAQPKMWVYGHTHNQHDFYIGKTRLVCNPFGYLKTGETATFDWGKHIETTPLKIV